MTRTEQAALGLSLTGLLVGFAVGIAGSQLSALDQKVRTAMLGCGFGGAALSAMSLTLLANKRPAPSKP